jgi:hypothetical protein
MRYVAAMAVVLMACTAAHAMVTNDDVRLLAVGDTINVAAVYRTSGAPDSVVWTFTVRNAPQLRVKMTQNGASVVTPTVKLVPSPALAEGDTTTVSACPTAYKRTATPSSVAFACLTKVFTKPGAPPVVTPDSLQLSRLMVTPKLVTLASGTSQQFCAYFSRADGGWDSASNNAPGCGITPASRYDPRQNFELQRAERRLALARWGFERDSIVDDPWLRLQVAGVVRQG